MSNVPEPRRYPGHLRAADADRAIVTDLLSAAYAEGRLTREEHDTRLAQAMEAKTFDDLRALTGDLVPDANTGRTVGAFSLAGDLPAAIIFFASSRRSRASASVMPPTPYWPNVTVSCLPLSE